MSLSKLRALDDFAEARRDYPEPAARPGPAPIAPGNSAPGRFGEPPGATGTVADVMRPPATVADTDHAAAAAYLMRHARAGALVVLDTRHTGRPVGIITEADIARAVADGKDVNEVRVHQLMTVRPAVISVSASIRDAAKTMLASGLRQSPVAGGGLTGGAGWIGIVDIADLCGALVDATAA
jgi:CBS domain-containing protein